MDIGIAKSKMFCGRCPYFIGVSHGEIATNRHQIRVGLYFWHICITWTTG